MPDVAIGAPGYDGSTANGGAVLVMKGGNWSGTYTPSSVSELVTGDGALGTGVAVADVTGDGVPDPWLASFGLSPWDGSTKLTFSWMCEGPL